MQFLTHSSSITMYDFVFCNAMVYSHHSSSVGVVMSRFHNACYEPTLDHDVVPYLDDNAQLSVERYRDRLYATIRSRREAVRKRRQMEGEEPDIATPTPADATPTSERAKSADATPTEIKKVSLHLLHYITYVHTLSDAIRFMYHQ